MVRGSLEDLGDQDPCTLLREVPSSGDLGGMLEGAGDLGRLGGVGCLGRAIDDDPSLVTEPRVVELGFRMLPDAGHTCRLRQKLRHSMVFSDV